MTEAVNINLSLASNNYIITFLQGTVILVGLEILQYICEWAKGTNNNIHKFKLLLATDNAGTTIWHLAVKWGKLDLWE